MPQSCLCCVFDCTGYRSSNTARGVLVIRAHRVKNRHTNTRHHGLDMKPSSVLLRVALGAALVAALPGCATRYDAYGQPIYRWQFGQDVQRDVDYSDPRLPILPKWRPSTDLWPTPSPYEFNDLSRWSFLREPAPLPVIARAVGDNAACAACSESTARLALLVSRADARDSSSRGGAR